MRFLVVVALSIVMGSVSTWAGSGPPDPLLPYQKKLTVSPGNGNLSFVFSLYDAEAVGSGARVWYEVKSIASNTTTRLIATTLGDITTLNGVDFSKQLWVQTELANGTVLGTRDKMGVVPYALWSATSNVAGVAGPPGPAGPQGPQGIPANPSEYYTKSQIDTLLNVQAAQISSLNNTLSSLTSNGHSILSSISITPANPVIKMGATQQFAATGTYLDNTTRDITSLVNWGSSNTSIATINSSALATTVSVGISTISADYYGLSNSTNLTITPPTLVSISISPDNMAILVGSTLQFTATGTYSDGSTANITSAVTWNSNAASLASINSAGLATGVEEGLCAISARQGGITSNSVRTMVAASNITSLNVGIQPYLNSLNSVIWSGTQYVAVGDSGAVLTSPDAIAWTIRSSGTTVNLHGVVWTGSLYVAIGDIGTIITSLDAITWSARSTGTTASFNGIAWSGSQFVAVGGNGNSGTIATSSDGATWTLQSSGTSSNLYAIVWSGTQYVTVGQSILTSSDGFTWTSRASNTNLYGIAWSGAKFVAIGFGAVMSSPDGYTWASSSTGYQAYGMHGIIWTGTRFLAAGGYSTTLNGNIFQVFNAILSSQDGSTWTIQSDHNPSSTILNSIAQGSSGYVTVGSGPSFSFSSNIYVSGDGNSWYSALQIGGQGLIPGKMIKAGTQYFVAGRNGQASGGAGNGGAIIASSDGTTWSYKLLSAGLNGIAWDGTQLVTVGSGGNIVTSPNGNNWTLRSSGTTKDLNKILWAGNQYIAVGASGMILTSPDGVVWTSRTSGTAYDLNAVAWTGSLLVAVGANGIIVTSPEGVTWTIRAASAFALKSIVWSGSMLVAAGEAIVTSSDGLNWSTRATGISLNSVDWSGKEYLAVGDSSARTSADGITWESVNFSVPASTDIIWTGSQFQLVGPWSCPPFAYFECFSFTTIK